MSPSPASALSPVQEKVATLLAAGVPLSHAAQQAGVSRQSIYNWQTSHPAFQAAIDTAQNDYTQALKDQLQHLSQLALNALEQILSDPKASPGIKLRAALAVLKRPASPFKNTWSLPVPLHPEIDEMLHFIEAHKVQSQIGRLTKLDTNSNPEPAPTQPAAPTAADPFPNTPRSAPCPCGSREKYKRCCGRNAPPSLHHRAA